MNEYERLLRAYWGYEDFRGIQRPIIESIGAGRDTLGLMPTGGGKSITFQVPALAAKGVCLVITPLIALMKDQIVHLQERGIMAAAIYSGMSRQEIIVTLENCIFGETKLLYISPERLTSDIFLAKLRHIPVSFITVDEAHCISQWGYDFRPSYLHIADIRHLLPDVPVLALTATATPEVVEDIQKKLKFKTRNVFSMSFERKNLGYVIRHCSDKDHELLHILQAVGGSAIVYVRSRKRTREIARYLESAHISANYFHAGLDPAIKDKHQDEWQHNAKRVIVATNAFGMGIDKPDVRVVIHYDCPDSIEAYFQEAGRAGRDGQHAYAVLLYDTSDKVKLNKRIDDNYPDKDFIREVYEHLAYYFQIGLGSGRGFTGAFSLDKFCQIYHLFTIRTDSALRILQRAGYIVYETDPDARARILFLLKRDELYRLEQTTDYEERVITALLRCYGGLFTDYVYIDLSLIALQSGLEHQQVYSVLKQLNQRHIVHFIPQRKSPDITYLCERVAPEEVVLGRDIYAARKENYSTRIQAMIAYIENDKECRSRQLLRYFGEKDSTDCHRCDVCAEHYGRINSQQQEEAHQAILSCIADGELHPITVLHSLNLPEKILHATLADMVSEEEIVVEDGQIRKG